MACKSVLSGLLSRDGLNNISLPLWDQAILSNNAELSYSSIQIIIWFINAYMPDQNEKNIEAYSGQYGIIIGANKGSSPFRHQAII